MSARASEAEGVPCIDAIPTPMGELWFGVDRHGSPVTGWSCLGAPPPGLEPAPRSWSLRERLARVLAGEQDAFEDLPLPTGTTFQLAAWREARRIPCGATATYGELARAIGRPRAPRAIGQAMRRNPAPILVPCHRVIGVGSTGGYAGQATPESAGSRVKEFLLRSERKSEPSPADSTQGRSRINR